MKDCHFCDAQTSDWRPCDECGNLLCQECQENRGEKVTSGGPFGGPTYRCPECS